MIYKNVEIGIATELGYRFTWRQNVMIFVIVGELSVTIFRSESEMQPPFAGRAQCLLTKWEIFFCVWNQSWRLGSVGWCGAPNNHFYWWNSLWRSGFWCTLLTKFDKPNLSWKRFLLWFSQVGLFWNAGITRDFNLKSAKCWVFLF